MPTKHTDLEPVKDLKMVQRYLKYGIEFHEIVACFIEDANLHFNASIRSIDAESLDISMEIEEESFTKLDSNTLAAIDRSQHPVRLSYSVNEATLFVHGKFQRRSTRQIVVRAELPMFKLQRREALRMKVLAASNTTIKLGTNVYPLFDISAGGIGIVVGLDEEYLYKTQQIFPACTLNFLGKEIKVNLEVKNILSASKDGLKWKVGFQFKALPAAIENMIAREAYLQTSKIWSRWL